MIFSAILISIWVLFMPNVSAIDCIQCRVRLENEKIVNGDPTGGCLLQPGRDNPANLSGELSSLKDRFKGFWRPFQFSRNHANYESELMIPKKDLRQNVMKNSTGAMYVMNMARKWLEVVKMQPQFVSIFVCRSCLKMNWFSFEGCDSRLRKLKLVQKDVLQRWTVA